MVTPLADLTLDQKITLVSGADFWRTCALPEAGIAQVKLTDGPNGARGDLARHVPAACFPVGVALGATWNPDLVGEIGRALGEEAKTKNAHVLLAPTINLQRTPIGGRNFECFSEDPCLTGALAVAYVDGVQSQGVGACPKHYVGNDTEYERLTISSNIDARTLREVYLRPFERAVTKARPWMVMAAYNRINGISACSHRELIVDILKDEWGFDGVVVSDWGAGRDTVGDALGGLDLEMPGPTRIWGETLKAAVEAGEVPLAEIDDKAGRLLRLIGRAQPTDGEAMAPEQGIDRPDHRALIRRAAAEAMVLLKNDGAILPLKRTSLRRLAIIGPNARTGQIMGGGSAFVNSHAPVHPLEGLSAAFADADILHEPGCTNYKYLPLFPRGTVTSPDGASEGFLVETFDGDTFDAPAASSDILPTSRLRLLDAVTGRGPAAHTALRVRGRFTPASGGAHTLGLFSAGPARLIIDGDTVIDNWSDWSRGESFYNFGSNERRAGFEFEAGRVYDIEVEYLRPPSALVSGLQFGIDAPLPADAIARAAKAAASADAAILVLGSNADWESEGHDRKTMQLPGRQDALADAVLAANPDTIIVMNVGAATAMPWYDTARAVLVSWFPGEEMGTALSDVITGAAEPSGRLPFTWPRRLEDHPAYATYPGANGEMDYAEGLLIGHRWYERKGIEPLAAFGAGLGYGAVEIASTAAGSGPGTVTVSLRNGASRDSQVAVQIYARTSSPAAHEPAAKLVGFRKITVPAGSVIEASVPIDRKSLMRWNAETASWQEETGFKLSAALRANGPFHDID